MVQKTNEQFIKELAEKKKGLYTALEPYVKSNVKIKFKHNVCGNEFYATPNFILKDEIHGCGSCFGNKAKQKTNEQFLKEVYEQVGEEYTFIEKYISRAKPITVRHNVCGKEYKVAPYNFLLGTRCKECGFDKKRITVAEAEERIHNRIGNDFKIVGEYVSLQHKTDILHTVCGNVSSTRITDIIQKGTSCRYCTMSNGEKLVKSVLDEKGIKYETQKSFKDLKNVNYLYLDFYLPDLKVAIEYQGIQHYIPKNFGGTTAEVANEALKLQKINDNIKREYAKDNNIKLIEVPYTINTLDTVRKYLNKNL